MKLLQRRPERSTCGDALNSNSFCPLGAGCKGDLGLVQCRVEERVDQRRLAEARLACGAAQRVSTQARTPRPRTKPLTDNHSRELEALLDALAVDLVRQVGESNVAHQLFPDNRAQSLCRGVALPTGSRDIFARIRGHLRSTAHACSTVSSRSRVQRYGCADLKCGGPEWNERAGKGSARSE